MFPKAILTSLVAGALAVNALSIPIARAAPEPESREIDARAIGLPQITTGLAALSSITPLIPNFIHRHKREDQISSREPGEALDARDPVNPFAVVSGIYHGIKGLKGLKFKRGTEGELLARELQGLDARDPVNPFAVASGIYHGIKGLKGLKFKREADGEVLSRELQQALDARDPFHIPIPFLNSLGKGFKYRRGIEGEIASREPQQGLDARDPISPLSLGLTGLSVAAPLIGNLFHKGKREAGNELLLRALQQEIDARDPISPLSLGLTGISTVAPLIGNLFHKGKREVGDVMLEREIHDWVQRAESIPTSASHPKHPHHHHHHKKVTAATHGSTTSPM